MMESKVLRNALVKVAADAGDQMIYEGIFSVFGNKDHAGDIVQPGAFADSLDEWRKSGAPVPVYYAHRMDDPNMLIGKVLDIAEVMPGDPRLEGAKTEAAKNGGLWARVQLNDNDPVAAKVWRGVKDRTLRQSSFSYDIDAAHFEEKVEDGSWDASFFSLDKVTLLELGPCPLGCNDQTDVLVTKRREEGFAAAKSRAASERDTIDPNAKTDSGDVDTSPDEVMSVEAAQLALAKARMELELL